VQKRREGRKYRQARRICAKEGRKAKAETSAYMREGRKAMEKKKLQERAAAYLGEKSARAESHKRQLELQEEAQAASPQHPKWRCGAGMPKAPEHTQKGHEGRDPR
jgi:hypothetical protein